MKLNLMKENYVMNNLYNVKTNGENTPTQHI